VAALDPDALLIDLDDRQREAVTSPATPLAIVAPAGSGKTRVLTRRIAWRVATGDAEPQHVLALTFTRRAAGELAARLRSLGLRGDVAAGTFHAVAYAQLRARWLEHGWRAPSIIGSRAGLLSELPSVRKARLAASDVAAEIDWAKARVIAADRYAEAASAARRRPPATAARIAAMYEEYEDVKRARRLIDFDDLLRLCIDAVETDATFAATQRWRFRHLFVDEFQDVNPLQLRLLEAWRGSHHDLCVVGDPQQAIYGWNGAYAGYLREFQRLYPPAEVVVLDRNYRSTPQILAAADDVLVSAELRPHEAEALPHDGPAPRLDRYDSDVEEATAIARAVRDHHTPGTPWSAQAVLVRTHAQTVLLLEAFRAAGIPARVRGARGAGLLDRPVVRDALARMRAVRGPLAAQLTDLVADFEPDRTIDDDDREALDTLAELGREHLRVEPSATAASFAAWIGPTAQREPLEAGGDAVDVATFHAAKGLEWQTVHLAGLEDGFVPVAHARTRAARAEEARLLHVAMTRARRELRCSWAFRRAFGARVVERELSPFLRSLAGQPAPSEDDPLGSDPEWRDRVAEQRSQLTPAPPTPTAVITGLQRWRSTAARAARIEPDSLLSDRVLAAIAEQQPRSTDELAAVPGVDPLIAARFAEDILAAMATDPAVT
jgi:DNA helicase-2/ATP-dependent DNA helicase PcrA